MLTQMDAPIAVPLVLLQELAFECKIRAVQAGFKAEEQFVYTLRLVLLLSSSSLSRFLSLLRAPGEASS